MPQTYTEFLNMPKPEEGQDAPAAFLAARFDELDAAAGGYLSIDLGGLVAGNYDLDAQEARNRVIRVFGNPAGAQVVRIPDDTGAVADPLIVNACGGSFSTITVKSQGANAGNSAGVSVLTGQTRRVRHDGESAYPADMGVTTSSGGVFVPGALVYHSANQAVANTTIVALAFNSEVQDNNSIHDTVTNNSRLVLNKLGRWAVFANVRFAANATGIRAAYIRRNGNDSLRDAELETNAVTAGGEPTVFSLFGVAVVTAVTDYVEMVVYQNSGGSLNAEAATQRPSFGCFWIGE